MGRSMLHRLTRLSILVAFCNSPYAFADEKFDLGEQKAKVCMTCHGEGGISSIESYPNLRGQKMAYLITSLKSYQSRERSAGLAVLMQQQADALSDSDISDIAYYYSMLGSKVHESTNTKADTVK